MKRITKYNKSFQHIDKLFEEIEEFLFKHQKIITFYNESLLFRKLMHSSAQVKIFHGGLMRNSIILSNKSRFVMFNARHHFYREAKTHVLDYRFTALENFTDKSYNGLNRTSVATSS